MNRVLFLFLAALSSGETSIAQCDTTSLISVTLTVEKEYSLKFPKSHYSLEIATGQLDIKTDSVNEEQYDIEITIKNISTKPVFFWMMSCSWFENFQINNNYIHMQLPGCDKNIPQLVQLCLARARHIKPRCRKTVFMDPRWKQLS